VHGRHSTSHQVGEQDRHAVGGLDGDGQIDHIGDDRIGIGGGLRATGSDLR
jgi:hypothetical protein